MMQFLFETRILHTSRVKAGERLLQLLKDNSKLLRTDMTIIYNGTTPLQTKHRSDNIVRRAGGIWTEAECHTSKDDVLIFDNESHD